MIGQIEELIGQGRYFEARAKALALLADSDTLRVKQLYSLSMSKCGLPEAAMQYLEPVYKEFPDDPETAGILGGIYKEIFIKTKNQRFAVLSKDTYLKNFSSTKSFYTGINAATMSAISGQSKQGQQIASEVIAQLEGSSGNFWELASLAEAWLISKDRVKAKEYYLKARDLVTTDWGKINTIYNQLWLLNHYVAVPKELLKIFNPPVIAAFVGHMIDHPSRASSRFPTNIESKVKEALTSAITSLNVKIGYCSLACGGDIIFAEAIAETGGEVNIILPFSEPDFIEASVRFAGDQWVERYNLLVKKFPTTFITHEPYGGYDDLFFLQSGIIFGAAILRSHASHTKPHLFTVVSGLDLNRNEGGTRDTLNLWPYHENTLNINPDNFNTVPRSSSFQSSTRRVDKRKYKNRPVSYILLADFPNTHTAEKEMIWKSMQSKIEIQSPLPAGLVWNGDTVLAAYNSLGGTIDLCKILLAAVVRFHKRDSVKISLHVGPVHLTNSEGDVGNSIQGSPVDTLRLIQQYAAPGEVLASSQVSSELALNIDNYSIDYVGKFFPESTSYSQEIFKIDFS